MTTRLKGLVVTFDKDIREDDAQEWIKAIGMMKHVIDVRPVESEINDSMVEMRIRQELSEKLWAVLHPEYGGKK
jgi:hypothetical protein